MTQFPPDRIADVEQLEQLLSEPTAGVVEMFRKLPGDVIVLGAAGKMGPTLARMARRAADQAGGKRRIIAVARFSQPQQRARLESADVECIQADLLDPQQLGKLPIVPNVIFMAGMKFGSTGNESMTWAMNAHLPALVAEQYKESRIAVFSTGNIYGLTPITRGGSVETDAPAPVGEYAMSCLGRERMFEHFSRKYETKVSILRLNYATEMRYGVMVDLASKVFKNQPISLEMGNFNAIWQGDANAMALASLGRASTPPFILNIAGPEMLSVRSICEQFGKLMKRNVEFVGTESNDALVSNGQLSHRLFGYPRVTAEQMMQWIADWVMRGEQNIGKPTHFEARDGKF